jgi:hypothetical protein
MWRARPVTSRLWRRVGGRELRDDAGAVETWAPATTRTERAAISLDREFDRAIDFAPGLIRAAVAANMAGRVTPHGATMAYRLDDAIIVDGCVYTRRSFDALCDAPRRPFISGIAETRAEGLLCTDTCISRYFGDWLMCGMSLELMAEQRNLLKMVVPTGVWPNAQGYRERLDLPAPPVSPVSTPIRFDALWFVDDRGMNDDRLARFAELRQRARRGIGSGPDRVYLDRGALGVARGQVDEDSVRAAMAARGFTIVRPEQLSLSELAHTLGSARLCVGVEGSALTHATMFMPPGGALAAIQPPRRFTDSMKLFADAVGLRFGFVVGEADGGAFHVDLARLTATLDLVEQAIGLAQR